MTQRVDLAAVMDRLAIDELVSRYAVALDDADWGAYRALFTADGRVDYRGPGGVEGPASEVADWLERTLTAFPVRQHLIVNRRVRLPEPDGYPVGTAELRADYVSPMRTESGDDFVSGGRYLFTAARTEEGWLLSGVEVHERWRRGSGVVPAGD
ncbi:nuclear transport factor 2 family protein [Streptomyces sp. CAU 1734]|uniref:nuclear transport factor 2 family protein n=1 Tax=Streptomyces sp. CAU 1734 TaxID=3140360 RepID=UPI0032619196